MNDLTDPSESIKRGTPTSAPSRANREPELIPLDPAEVAEYSAFYRAATPRLVAFLIWQGASLTAAADVAQDTMTEAFRVWRNITNPRAWIRRVASRTYARRLAAVEETPIDQMPEPNPLLTSMNETDALDQHSDVLRLLALLPMRQRQVMAWTFDGFTPTEIAHELNISPEAARAALASARRGLATHLRKEASDA